MILNARENSNHKLLLKLGHVRDMGSALSRLSDICEANANPIYRNALLLKPSRAQWVKIDYEGAFLFYEIQSSRFPSTVLGSRVRILEKIVNCYLVHVLLNYAQPAHNVGGLVIHWTAGELTWQYIAIEITYVSFKFP
jgi:hypothetical protein